MLEKATHQIRHSCCICLKWCTNKLFASFIWYELTLFPPVLWICSGKSLGSFERELVLLGRGMKLRKSRWCFEKIAYYCSTSVIEEQDLRRVIAIDNMVLSSIPLDIVMSPHCIRLQIRGARSHITTSFVWDRQIIRKDQQVHSKWNYNYSLVNHWFARKSLFSRGLFVNFCFSWKSG